MPVGKKSNAAPARKGAGKGGKGDATKTKKAGTKKKMKSKLSEDAKSRQQEQRAAVEEERRRLREELINSFLKHKLQKEQNLTRLNQAKLIQKWRTIMRDNKCQELTQELEIMRTNFDRHYLRNLQDISQLMEQLSELGHDYSSLIEEHKKATQETYGVHLSRLSGLDIIFDQEKNTVESTLTRDHRRATEMHLKDKSDLFETLKALQGHYHDSYMSQQIYYKNLKDDIINQGLEEEQTIRMSLERRLGLKWQQLYESCVEGGDLDEQRWLLYSQLKTKDDAALERERALDIRIQQLSAATTHYVDQLQKRQISFHQDRQKLQDQRDELHAQRERWRTKLLRQQQHHSQMLKAAATSSAEAADHLEDLVRHGMSILRSGQRCAQLKPVYGPPPGADESQMPGPSSTTWCDHFRHFWTRFNTAYLEMILLQKYQTELLRNRAEAVAPVDSLSGWSVNGKQLAAISYDKKS